jgi:hypothetical protein
MNLARFAVGKNGQGKGLGAGLLKHAALRPLQRPPTSPAAALSRFTPKTIRRAFYRHFGFAQGLGDPLHPYVPIKELKAMVA